MLLEFAEKNARLVVRQVLEAALQDAAPVGMRSQVADMSLEGDDEGQAFGRYAFDQPLDNLEPKSSAHTYERMYADIHDCRSRP